MVFSFFAAIAGFVSVMLVKRAAREDQRHDD
jgi:hypothetical protein